MTDENIDHGYVRARRNVILLSVFIMIYCSGAIHFKEDIQILGLEMQRGREITLIIWIFCFHGYFLWRYWCHWRIKSPLKTTRDVIKKRALESFLTEAVKSFKAAYPNEPRSIRDFYTTLDVDGTTPVIRASEGPVRFMDESPSSKFIFSPRKKSYFFACFRETALLILKDLDFSEHFFPYLLWLTATFFLAAKILFFAPA